LERIKALVDGMEQVERQWVEEITLLAIEYVRFCREKRQPLDALEFLDAVAKCVVLERECLGKGVN
jgi:hypothetical protein